MPTFKSLDDAMKYIQKATAESMKEVGDKLEDIMKDTIDEEVYDVYPAFLPLNKKNFNLITHSECECG